MICRTKKFESKASTQPVIESIPAAGLSSGRQACTEKGISQKKAIEGMIRYIFVLREKGWSWNQITRLLNEECKFNLQTSTVRSYFREMVPKHRDICRAAMAENLLEMAKIKQQNKLAGKPEAIRMAMLVIERQRSLAAATISEKFGEDE